MTKFTEHAIGQRRGAQVNPEYIQDVIANSNSFVPADLSQGYRENRKTGKLELITDAGDAEKEYETKCENRICFGTFTVSSSSSSSSSSAARGDASAELLVKVNKKQRLGDFHVTQRSKRAIRDMVKRFDFETSLSLQWRGEWDRETKTFTINKKTNDDGEEKVQMENGGVFRTAGIAECSYDFETKETKVYFSEEDAHRRLTNKHEFVGQCANAIEFLKRMSEFEIAIGKDNDGGGDENVIQLSLETHGVAEDIGADLIAAKLRAKKEKESLLLKSETEEETAKRMQKEMNKVKSSVLDAVKFANSLAEKRKGGADGGNEDGNDDENDDDDEKMKKKKKKLSRFDESDDSDSD
jgi:hypothetical protein